jgi:hypothetical protein
MNSFLPTTADEQISQLLGCTVEQLDITVDDFLAAEQRYQDVAKHLADEGADIYVQGSFMLGTVISPYGRFGEYDLDLVCHSPIAKTSITQKDLKDRVGGHLADYLEDAEPIDDELPELDESRRCWTLAYRRFHMDVLPAIPDTDSASGTAILLTDKQLRLWQHSNPKAYVAWFRRQCAQQFDLERKALAKAAAGTVDDVPTWRVRTPLHRVVQILKRHRDVHFGSSDARTPSSLITTLAARSYYGETDLLNAAMSVVQRMPGLVEVRNGNYWVENPVCEGENFADKWNEYPERRVAFRAWLAQVEKDLEAAAAETSGARAVHQRLEKAFGVEPVRKAVGVLGQRTRTARESGRLRMTTTGALTSGAGAAVPNHRFFGGPAPA